MTISKPTSLEMILMHSKDIPIFKNMEDGEICALVGNSKTHTIEKDEHVTVEGISNSDIHIIIYGSFDVFIEKKQVDKLNKGDMFGVGSILRKNESIQSSTTIEGASYKNLLVSFRINPAHINPCLLSSKLHQNIARYFARKLSIAHKNFSIPG